MSYFENEFELQDCNTYFVKEIELDVTVRLWREIWAGCKTYFDRELELVVRLALKRNLSWLQDLLWQGTWAGCKTYFDRELELVVRLTLTGTWAGCKTFFDMELELVVRLTLTGNLSWLYSSEIRRLWVRVFLVFMILTMAASTWYWRSWNTRSVVVVFSSGYRGHYEPLYNKQVPSVIL